MKILKAIAHYFDGVLSDLPLYRKAVGGKWKKVEVDDSESMYNIKLSYWERE